MLVEATQHPIRYTMTNGMEVRLVPGMPVDLPESQAKTLLQKAPDRVRLVVLSDPSPVTVESVKGLTPVYWESRGRIIGPGKVSHIAKDGGESWLCVELGASVYWVRDHLLRSRQAFEGQGKRVCNCCRGAGFWESVHGVTVCRQCHPPGSPELERTK